MLCCTECFADDWLRDHIRIVANHLTLQSQSYVVWLPQALFGQPRNARITAVRRDFIPEHHISRICRSGKTPLRFRNSWFEVG